MKIVRVDAVKMGMMKTWMQGRNTEELLTTTEMTKIDDYSYDD